METSQKQEIKKRKKSVELKHSYIVIISQAALRMWQRIEELFMERFSTVFTKKDSKKAHVDCLGGSEDSVINGAQMPWAPIVLLDAILSFLEVNRNRYDKQRLSRRAFDHHQIFIECVLECFESHRKLGDLKQLLVYLKDEWSTFSSFEIKVQENVPVKSNEKFFRTLSSMIIAFRKGILDINRHDVRRMELGNLVRMAVCRIIFQNSRVDLISYKENVLYYERPIWQRLSPLQSECRLQHKQSRSQCKIISTGISKVSDFKSTGTIQPSRAALHHHIHHFQPPSLPANLQHHFQHSNLLPIIPLHRTPGLSRDPTHGLYHHHHLCNHLSLPPKIPYGVSHEVVPNLFDNMKRHLCNHLSMPLNIPSNCPSDISPDVASNSNTSNQQDNMSPNQLQIVDALKRKRPILEIISEENIHSRKCSRNMNWEDESKSDADSETTVNCKVFKLETDNKEAANLLLSLFDYRE